MLPTVDRGETWSTDTPALAPIAPARARAAAEYWLNMARAEHASVAAFARVSMELMVVGAPIT